MLVFRCQFELRHMGGLKAIAHRDEIDKMLRRVVSCRFWSGDRDRNCAFGWNTSHIPYRKTSNTSRVSNRSSSRESTWGGGCHCGGSRPSTGVLFRQNET